MQGCEGCDGCYSHSLNPALLHSTAAHCKQHVRDLHSTNRQAHTNMWLNLLGTDSVTHPLSVEDHWD